jgi:hypothetical protein
VSQICKKAYKHLYFLRKLRDVHVEKIILSLFYSSIIESVVSFCIICYYGNLPKYAKHKLNKICNTAVNLGCDALPFEELYERSVLKKLKCIMDNESHLMSKYIQWLPSGKRLRSLMCRTKRFQNSYVPMAIRNFFLVFLCLINICTISM